MTKKNKIVPYITLPLSIALLVGCDSFTPDGLTGTGTEEDPYILNEAQDLMDLNEVVLASETSDDPLYIEVSRDFEIKDVEFKGIGDPTHPLKTYFNGNNHKISGLNIRTFDKNQQAYGLVNVAMNSIFYNLELEYDIEIEAKGVGCVAYAGGLVGYGQNIYLKNIHGKGNVDVESYSSKAQLIAGGLIGMNSLGGAAYVTAINVSHIGNAIAYQNGETTGLSYAGGVIGYTSTSYGQGIYAIMEAYQEGNIKADDAAGGIVSRTDYYVSIQDAVARGETIETFSADGNYAGGIAGILGYETLVANTFVEYSSITAADGSKSYPSFAGEITGYYAVDSIEEGDTDGYLGTGNYNNASKVATVTGQQKGLSGTKLTSSSYDAVTSVAQLRSFEDKNGAVSFIKGKELSNNADLILNHNYSGAFEEVVAIVPGTYDYSIVQKIEEGPSEVRSGYSFYAYYYDEALTAQYRFYVPFIGNTTLYAAWGDVSTLVGTYEYSITWGSTTTTGLWVITETNFYWINPYYETFEYTYSFYKNQLQLHGDGDYDGEIILVKEDGTLEAHDINEYDAVYTATKQAYDYITPDYTGAGFLGDWYTNKSNGATFTLLANGNATGQRKSSYSETIIKLSGGYRVTDNNMTIRISEAAYGEYKYSNEYDIIYSSTEIFTRSPVTNKITSTDSKVQIYNTENRQYVIFDGEVKEAVGSLVEDQEITFVNASGSYTYVYKNGSLILKGSEGGDGGEGGEGGEEGGETPQFDGSIYGTWEHKGNHLTLIINKDNTGTYSDGTNTYTVTLDADGKLVGGTLVGQFDAEDTYVYLNNKGNLVVHFCQDYGDSVFELEFTKTADAE